MYTVDVIDRNPEHVVEFQELDDGLRVTIEPRQATAFTRRISNQYDQNTHDTDPQEQEWTERVNIGTIPSAYQLQLVELLRSHQQVFAQDDDDVGLTQTVKHRIYTTDESPVKAANRRIPPPQFDEVKTHIRDLFHKGIIKPSQSEFASPIVICRRRTVRLGCVWITVG